MSKTVEATLAAPLYSTISAPRDMTVPPETTLQELRRMKADNYRNIIVTNLLHRKTSLIDWINVLWALLTPNGSLHIAVPNGAEAWKDPCAVREVNSDTFACFDFKGESYLKDCKPFYVVSHHLEGNNLHVRMLKA